MLEYLREETTINERVQRIIDHYNLNKSSFSKAIGLNNNMTITNIVSGRKNKPSYDILRKIAARFPVNLNWLILGKGLMLLDAEDDMESDGFKVEKIANDILRFPEKYEENLIFSKYIEGKCDKAIIANQNEFLLKFKKLDLDQLENP